MVLIFPTLYIGKMNSSNKTEHDFSHRKNLAFFTVKENVELLLLKHQMKRRWKEQIYGRNIFKDKAVDEEI